MANKANNKTATVKATAVKAAPVKATNAPRIPQNTWVAIGMKGTSCPPWLQGKSAAQLEKAGVHVGKVADYTARNRQRLGVPLTDIPLAEQPLQNRIHAWVGNRMAGVLIMDAAEAVKARKVVPVQFWLKNEPEEGAQWGLFPAGWDAAQVQPYVFATLKSAALGEGRIERRRLDDGLNSSTALPVTFTDPANKVPRVKAQTVKAADKGKGKAKGKAAPATKARSVTAVRLTGPATKAAKGNRVTLAKVKSAKVGK